MGKPRGNWQRPGNTIRLTSLSWSDLNPEFSTPNETQKETNKSSERLFGSLSLDRTSLAVISSLLIIIYGT